MERVGIRELRNDVSRLVRRAMSGERIAITVDGVPAAQLGPLNDGTSPADIEALVAAGLVRAPRASGQPPAPTPVRTRSGRTTGEILDEHRSR